MRYTFVALLAVCIFTQPAFAQNKTISASDGRIVYVGRTLQEPDGAVSFDWSGVKATVKFTGTRLEVLAEDSGCDMVNVWIDQEPVAKEQKKLTLKGSCTLTLAQGLKKGEHIAIIQKRSEGFQGRITLREFTTDGSFLQAPPSKERLIEFIGDSYTCGYGTEALSRDEGFKMETENCNLTYAEIIGRFFGADVLHISNSGKGLVRNYDSFKAATMPERYSRVFDEQETPQWKFSGKTPDIVVIYLGTNDFSCGLQPSLQTWKTAFAGLLNQIRSHYGDKVPVLTVASRADINLAQYVAETAQTCGDKNVHWTILQSNVHDNTGELGASWHPNYKGHRKVACCMIPYISTLTGWEMPFKTIE